VFGLGVGSGVLRFVSFHRGLGDMGGALSDIKGSLVLGGFFSFAGCLGLLLFSGRLGSVLFDSGAVLGVFAASVPFIVLVDIVQESLRGLGRTREYVFCRFILSSLLRLGVAAFFVLGGYGVVGAAWAYVVSWVLVLGCGVFFLSRAAGLGRVFSAGRPDYLGILRFSWPVVFVSAFWSSVAWTDTLMLSILRPVSDVGLYNAALPFCTLMGFVLSGFNVAFAPQFTGMFARGCLGDMRAFFARTVSWINAFTLPIFCLLALYPGSFLSVFFGEGYGAAAFPLLVLGFGFFFNASVGPTGAALNAVGRTGWNLVNSVLCLGLNVWLDWVLIPVYGISGAALATATALVLWNLLAVGELYLGYGVWPYEWGVLKPFSAAVLASALVSAAFGGALSGLSGVAAASAAFGAAYFGLLWASGFFREDRGVFLAAFR
jgi:O-antigen/teichoic acid export membrane protein